MEAVFSGYRAHFFPGTQRHVIALLHLYAAEIIKSQTFSTSNLRKNLAETRPWAFMAPQAAEVVGKHQCYHPQGP